MPTEDAKKAEQLGWQLLADGNVGYVLVQEFATLPLSGNVVAVALRVPTRTGQTQTRQLQVGLPLQMCKQLAEQLLAAVSFAERDAALTQGKPN
ncbi:MAG: hypothetical protein ABI216_15075 [Devosia sp.]